MKAYNAKISITCSCQCKTLFASPITIKTTATKILEIDMGKDAEFFYLSPLFSANGQQDNALVNQITSLKVGGFKAQTSSVSSPQTPMVFDNDGTIRFVGINNRETILKEDDAPHFKFNGINFKIKPTFGPIGNPVSKRNTINFIPAKQENGQVISKIKWDLSTGIFEENALRNNKDLKQLTFTAGLGNIDEKQITHNTPYPDISLINTAKDFEKKLKEKQEPITIKEPEAVKPETIGEPDKEKCDISFGEQGYYCKQFSMLVPSSPIEYNGYKYDCKIGTDCNEAWCCSGDKSVRCCKQIGKATTKPKGDRSWYIAYREIGGSNSQQFRGRLGLDINYNVPMNYGFDSGPRAFRYDYGEITHVTNVLNAYDPLNEFVKKDSYAKTDVAEFKNWFEKIAKPIFKCKIYLSSTKWPDKTPLESIKLTYKPGSLPDAYKLASDLGFLGGYAELIQKCAQIPAIKSVYGDPAMKGGSSADKISQHEWEFYCRPEIKGKQELGLNVYLKKSDGSPMYKIYKDIFYGYYLYDKGYFVQDTYGRTPNGEWKSYKIDLFYDRFSPTSIANYGPELGNWFKQTYIKNQIKEWIEENCKGKQTITKLDIWAAPGTMPITLGIVIAATSAAKVKTAPTPPKVDDLPDQLVTNREQSYQDYRELIKKYKGKYSQLSFGIKGNVAGSWEATGNKAPYVPYTKIFNKEVYLVARRNIFYMNPSGYYSLADGTVYCVDSNGKSNYAFYYKIDSSKLSFTPIPRAYFNRDSNVDNCFTKNEQKMIKENTIIALTPSKENTLISMFYGSTSSMTLSISYVNY